ncbi:MAG: RNA methyltransferase, partial [Bacteroidales bacterium]|nr:RNA methyltransferase [Bacteroidales bacterium]
EGDLELVYKANYLCRTALRILVPVAEFKVENETDLYREIYKMGWEDYLTEKKTFAIEAVTSYSPITHSKYAALKAKDAIADRFRDNSGRRPSVDKDTPDVRINIRIFRNECTVSLDSSGESLHKRGYRKKTGPAPISEVLAAGLIQLTGWNKKSLFIDPMCGSGTIPIEAALYAKNIPAGYFRERFGFETWLTFDKKVWKEIKSEANSRIKDTIPAILASDISGRILAIAKENISNAGLSSSIRSKAGCFSDLKPYENEGVVVANPPYGERMKKEDMIKFYKEIGDALKMNFTGFDAWIITSDLVSFKFLGLRPSRKIKVYNGKLECRFFKFEMYKGSKRQKTDNAKNRSTDFRR